MLLGTILKRLEDETTACEAMLGLGELALLMAVEAERAHHGETLGDYVAGATQRFSRLASDDDWLRVMTALERADNPAGACLAIMVRWSIDRDAAERRLEGTETGQAGGCGCGPGGCHDGA